MFSLPRAWVPSLLRELRSRKLSLTKNKAKKMQMNLFTNQKQTHRHRKQIYLGSYSRLKPLTPNPRYRMVILNLGYSLGFLGEHLRNRDALVSPSESLKLLFWGGVQASAIVKALWMTLSCSQSCEPFPYFLQSSRFIGKMLKPNKRRNLLRSQGRSRTQESWFPHKTSFLIYVSPGRRWWWCCFYYYCYYYQWLPWWLRW